jgi:hypothetical protein
VQGLIPRMPVTTIAKFFAVPLKVVPLLLIIVFSGLLTLAARATLFGIPLGLVVIFGFINYSFILLDSLIEGIAEPPVLSIEMMNAATGHRGLATLVVVISIFFGSNVGSYWFGQAFSVALGIVTASVLPAVIAVQGVTGAVVQSLNPVRCFLLASRLGRDYLVIVVSVVVLYALAYTVIRVSALPFIVRIAVFLYAWLAVFTLIGSVLHERRADIRVDDAYEPEPVQIDRNAEHERQRDRQIDAIYAEWRGGAQKNTWQSVVTLLERSSDPVAESRWLYERVARWPDSSLAVRLAQDLVPRLLAEKRNSEVLDLVNERLQADPDFRPLTSATLLRVAHVARDGGDRRIARALVKDFERLFPNDPMQDTVAELQKQLER